MNSKIAKFDYTKVIIMLLSMLLITGCTTNYKVLPSKLSQLSLGMSKSDVKGLLDGKNEKSNFRFNLLYNDNKYECISYNVKSTYSSYSLIFVDDSLDLVLPESLLNNIWCEHAEKNTDLPFKSGFERFVGSLFSKKIDVRNIDFSEINYEAKRESEKLKSELIGYGVSCLPLYAIFAPIFIPYTHYEIQKIEKFMKEVISLPLRCEKSEITEKLGKPFKILKGTNIDYEIWVYNQMQYLVVGIRDGRLEWIGEYYNIIKIFNDRGINY